MKFYHLIFYLLPILLLVHASTNNQDPCILLSNGDMWVGDTNTLRNCLESIPPSDLVKETFLNISQVIFSINPFVDIADAGIPPFRLKANLLGQVSQVYNKKYKYLMEQLIDFHRIYASMQNSHLSYLPPSPYRSMNILRPYTLMAKLVNGNQVFLFENIYNSSMYNHYDQKIVTHINGIPVIDFMVNLGKLSAISMDNSVILNSMLKFASPFVTQPIYYNGIKDFDTITFLDGEELTVPLLANSPSINGKNSLDLTSYDPHNDPMHAIYNPVASGISSIFYSDNYIPSGICKMADFENLKTSNNKFRFTTSNNNICMNFRYEIVELIQKLDSSTSFSDRIKYSALVILFRGLHSGYREVDEREYFYSLFVYNNFIEKNNWQLFRPPSILKPTNKNLYTDSEFNTDQQCAVLFQTDLELLTGFHDKLEHMYGHTDSVNIWRYKNSIIIRVKSFVSGLTFGNYINFLVNTHKIVKRNKNSKFIIDVCGNDGGYFHTPCMLLSIFFDGYEQKRSNLDDITLDSHRMIKSKYLDVIMKDFEDDFVHYDRNKKELDEYSWYYDTFQDIKYGGLTSHYTEEVYARVEHLAYPSLGFKPKVFILTDGNCFSSCAHFVDKMATAGLAKIVAIGGIKCQVMDSCTAAGSNVIEYDQIYELLNTTPPIRDSIIETSTMIMNPNRGEYIPRAFIRNLPNYRIYDWQSVMACSAIARKPSGIHSKLLQYMCNVYETMSAIE